MTRRASISRTTVQLDPVLEACRELKQWGHVPMRANWDIACWQRTASGRVDSDGTRTGDIFERKDCKR